MNFSFHPEAKAEFNEAIEYYEDIDSRLVRRTGPREERGRVFHFAFLPATEEMA